MVRILSQPSYRNPISTTFAVSLLAEQIARTDHEFWPADISLGDLDRFDPSSILGPSQIADAYLLALAVKNGGRLVTLDRSVPLRAVRGAEPLHLVVI